MSRRPGDRFVAKALVFALFTSTTLAAGPALAQRRPNPRVRIPTFGRNRAKPFVAPAARPATPPPKKKKIVRKPRGLTGNKLLDRALADLKQLGVDLTVRFSDSPELDRLLFRQMLYTVSGKRLGGPITKHGLVAAIGSLVEVRVCDDDRINGVVKSHLLSALGGKRRLLDPKLLTELASTIQVSDDPEVNRRVTKAVTGILGGKGLNALPPAELKSLVSSLFTIKLTDDPQTNRMLTDQVLHTLSGGKLGAALKGASIPDLVSSFVRLSDNPQVNQLLTNQLLHTLSGGRYGAALSLSNLAGLASSFIAGLALDFAFRAFGNWQAAQEFEKAKAQYVSANAQLEANLGEFPFIAELFKAFDDARTKGRRLTRKNLIRTGFPSSAMNPGNATRAAQKMHAQFMQKMAPLRALAGKYTDDFTTVTEIREILNLPSTRVMGVLEERRRYGAYSGKRKVASSDGHGVEVSYYKIDYRTAFPKFRSLFTLAELEKLLVFYKFHAFTHAENYRNVAYRSDFNTVHAILFNETQGRGEQMLATIRADLDAFQAKLVATSELVRGAAERRLAALPAGMVLP